MVEPNCCFISMCMLHVTFQLRVPWAQFSAQCARFGMPASQSQVCLRNTCMRISLRPLTASTVATLVTVLALALLVAHAAAIAALASGALFASNFAMIAVQPVRTAAHIVANAAAAILAGYHALGCYINKTTKHKRAVSMGQISSRGTTHNIHSAGRNILLSIGICPFVCICRHSGTSLCKYLTRNATKQNETKKTGTQIDYYIYLPYPCSCLEPDTQNTQHHVQKGVCVGHATNSQISAHSALSCHK